MPQARLPLHAISRQSSGDLSPGSTDGHWFASPPYHPVASSSNISPNYSPSPAYASTVRLTELDMSEKIFNDPDPHFNESDAGKTAKPTVHYTDDTGRGMGPAPTYTRTDSVDNISSRASSIAGTDDDDSEDYDWSGEEDLIDEEAKFEGRMGIKTKPKSWGFKRIITMLFSTLIGSTFVAGLLITPALLIQFYWYKPDPTPERAYIKDNVQSWLFWAASNLVISWYLAMIIDVIPILAQFFISISWGHVSEYVKTRIEMYDSIKDSIKPLFYAGSGWASWVVIFGHIYNLFNTENPDESRASYTRRLAQVVEFFFFFALVICVKRMLSHAIAFSFHRTAYKDRVESVQEALAVIEKLRQYRPKVTPRSANKPGTRTPVFSGLGFSTPFSERDHFSFLTGALRAATPPGARPRKAGKGFDNGNDGDIDDEELTVVGSGTKNTMDWKGARKGKGKKRDRSSWIEGSDSAPTGEKPMSMVSPGDHSEIYSSHTDSSPLTPSGLPLLESNSPHRYPPTPKYDSPRTSIDGSHEGGDTLVQAARAIKSAVLHDARNLRGKSEGLASIAWNVSSTHEAKRLARSIYTRFKDRRRTYLLPSDFHPAFQTEAEAEAAFRVFDKDNNGDISRGEIKNTLVKVYRERRFLSRSMRDVGAALKTLDQIILFLSMVVLFFISLSVFGVQVGDSLTSVYSIGIAASFIFKNSASSAFDAIMFLFVTHPYDTGDRCFIDEEVLVVKKVGLFATVFARSDGTETYYFNSQLFTKFITNVRRSGKTFENLTMQVAWRTPLEKLDALEKCLNEWLSTEENRWFEPSTSITLQHIEFQRYLSLTIGISHNGNWQVRLHAGLSILIFLTFNKQDWGLRWTRKTAFHAAVQHYCRELDITCFESPMPIVYANPESGIHQSSPTTSPADEDPVSSTDGKQRSDETDATEHVAKEIKPKLGFLPPPPVQPIGLTRARKSRSRKTMLRSMES